MQKQTHKPRQNLANDLDDFDELMASLCALLTHACLTGCQQVEPTILERLNVLCNHEEAGFYPEQLKVLSKMKQLWETKLLSQQLDQLVH